MAESDNGKGIDLDDLVSKLMTKLGRRSDVNDDDDGEDYGRGRGRVPQERLRREIDKRRAAERDLADVRTQVEALQKGYADQLKAFQEAAASEVSQIGKRHVEDLALRDAALTDALGRQALRTAWQAQPKDRRGKSASEWWTSILDGQKLHREDPEKNAAPTIPRTIAAYLPSEETPATKPTGNGAPARSGWGSGPPAGPRRPAAKGLDAVPVDKGMDAFFAGLRGLNP